MVSELGEFSTAEGQDWILARFEKDSSCEMRKRWK